jgi:DNA-binding NtrC family response regulator
MREQRRILVVDDEPSSRLNIHDLLKAEGYIVDETSTGAEAVEFVRGKPYDAVLLDIRMPVMDGLTALQHIHKVQHDLPVIIFTAHGTSERAIEAMKLGAFDYLTKPFDIDELLAVIKRAAEYRKLSTDIAELRQRLGEIEAGNFRPDHVISKHRTMQQVFKMIGKVAPTDATVLIEGETGTGKELVANAIWYHSRRKEFPFVKVNCAAVPESLLESELFGYEKGAFTGADRQRQGWFEVADGGTLFLDEIAETSPALQSKLLRVLDRGEFQRVGGNTTLQADVRVLAATNRNLQEEVSAGRFRKDLYYRLHVVHITLPPLRERTEDIPLLVGHFLKKYGGKRNLIATGEAIELLSRYSWPGNVRELENMIERAAVLAQGACITAEHLSLPHAALPGFAGTDLGIPGTRSLRETLKQVERDTILRALEHTKWNRTEAARLLQIDRRTLFEKIKEYNLQP